mmetsp:Transcript_58688/g.134611  ORF Transcript_58688/g.134611 Transcript_58688/m.134611 type:complete len:205 (-) Transcript_58688:205-819(-)
MRGRPVLEHPLCFICRRPSVRLSGPTRMIEGLWAHNLQRTDAPPIRQHRFVWAPLPGLFKVVLPDVVARQRRVVGLQARRAKGRFAENDRADEHEWRESVLFGVDELVDDPLDDRKEAVPAGVARRNQHVHLPLVDSGVREHCIRSKCALRQRRKATLTTSREQGQHPAVTRPLRFVVRHLRQWQLGPSATGRAWHAQTARQQF